MASCSNSNPMAMLDCLGSTPRDQAALLREAALAELATMTNA